MADHPGPPLSEPLVISRTFDAPQALVWAALTEADRLAGWWGPAGMNIRIITFDLRPEGLFHYSMQAGNGPLMWGRFMYREVKAPDRIVFVNAFSDEAGGITRHPLTPGWPQEVLNTWVLTEENNQTTLTLHAVPIHATPEEISTFNQWHGAVRQGFEYTFNQLAGYLDNQ